MRWGVGFHFSLDPESCFTTRGDRILCPQTLLITAICGIRDLTLDLGTVVSFWVCVGTTYLTSCHLVNLCDCSPDNPGTCSVDKNGLSSTGIKGLGHQASFFETCSYSVA